MQKIRVFIVGAGKAGELISSEIQKIENSAFEVIGFVDDDKSKIGGKLNGHSIYGPIGSLSELVREHGIEELIIAMPSERGVLIRKIIELTYGQKLTYKIIPRLSEVLMQNFKEGYLKFIRRVQPEDLLGGEINKTEQKLITDFARRKTILITGAAGSIGSELSRQITAHRPERIILYDWWENGIFELKNSLDSLHKDTECIYVIGDVKDRPKLAQVFSKYRPDVVFHAAAYKHVPLMEGNAVEAIKNNIMGTKNVAETAILYSVKQFILVSTDKAVNPTNIMGATKRSAEMLISVLGKSQDRTSFSAVRFGNVINSNGSAIPIFEKQIQEGGPVKVTHRQITRYFMTIPEAVHLILQAWVIGRNGDLFVLDMGEPIKIFDLAKLLIGLQGYQPIVDIDIEITGLRPGEKLFEELLIKEEETKSTKIKKIFRTKNADNFDSLKFVHLINQLIDQLEVIGEDESAIKSTLRELVPTYKPAIHQ